MNIPPSPRDRETGQCALTDPASVGRCLHLAGMVTLLLVHPAHPAGAQDAAVLPVPVAHWPLSGHATESVRGAITTVHGKVDFPSTNSGASFRGAESWLEVPAAQAPALGTNDFTLAVWMQSDERTGLVSGDLASQYDGTRRRGFHLTLKSNPGVTSNQSNWRHLQFGIDDDRASDWRDCGRPGQALFAFALATHEGAVYAGTCEPDLGQSGRVYRYTGGTNWIDCGAPDGANSVTSFAVHQGSLYAGTGKYRVAGSSLPESPNTTLGGQIFRYLGTNQWLSCGRLPSTESVGGMVVFRGALYASSLYKPAGFFRYEGGTQWTDCGTPDGTRVVPLTVHNGFLYAGSYDRGHVYRYDGQTWVDCGALADNTQTYSFTSYEGQLLVGTWPSGRVYRFDDLGRWSDLGRLGQELEVMGMAVHNGRLIAGTLPLAEAYSYEGGTEWKRLAQLDTTPDVKYRRAWTLTEHQGALFCSTLPSGKVFAFSAGLQVTHDHSVSSNWHHVAAVKSVNTLKLYLDGQLVSESARRSGKPFDLESDAPWRIGTGKNGPFNGQLADLRVYRQALEPAVIRGLAAQSPTR